MKQPIHLAPIDAKSMLTAFSAELAAPGAGAKEPNLLLLVLAAVAD